MEHLLRYTSCTQAPIEVPYVCHTPYDGLVFREYPRRRRLEGVNRLDLALPKEELDAYMQAWLFFGVLSEIFDDFKLDDFVRQGPLGPLVTTAVLPNYIQRWRDGLKDCPLREMKVKIDKASEVLKQVYNFLHTHFEVYEDEPTPRPEIWLSISVLGHTLAYHLSEIYGMNRPGGPPLLPFFTGEVALRPRMLGQGWCPSGFSRLKRSCLIRTMYFASTMDRRDSAHDHSACTEDVCNASQIDEKTYTTQHVKAGCKCDFKGPSIDDLHSSIENRLILVLNLRVTDNNSVFAIG
jgi:hypothetical protein